MKGEIKNILKVACIYMATIIGAGFASGQEIVQFFSTYFEGGFYGIILAGILFSIIGYVVLDKVYRERIKNYDEFLFPSVGYFLGWIMEIVVTLFVFSVFCIMIAGLVNILMNKLNIPFIWGVVLVTVICMVVILNGIKGVMALSSVVTPVLIAGILGVGLYIIAFRDIIAFNIAGCYNLVTRNWFFSSLIYVSYNSITSVVVMCSLLPYLKTRRVGIIGGLLGGILLCFIAFILNLAIFIFYPGSLAEELPVLGIIERHSGILSCLYSLILWLAMFVSAVTSGYCFTDRVGSRIRTSKKLLTVIVCAFAIPLSSFGFSNLIAALYPVFGYIGLFMVFVILAQGIMMPFVKRGNK